jgi:hypothetical protein
VIQIPARSAPVAKCFSAGFPARIRPLVLPCARVREAGGYFPFQFALWRPHPKFGPRGVQTPSRQRRAIRVRGPVHHGRRGGRTVSCSLDRLSIHELATNRPASFGTTYRASPTEKNSTRHLASFGTIPPPSNSSPPLCTSLGCGAADYGVSPSSPLSAAPPKGAVLIMCGALLGRPSSCSRTPLDWPALLFQDFVRCLACDIPKSSTRRRA